MNSDLEYLDLIDLISERHLQLRKRSEEMWNNHSDIYLSNSEWFILTRIYQKEQTTISYVTKHVDISRQATHKFIKQLQQKGLVEIEKHPTNKKEKSITLTPLGKECYEKNESLKAQLAIQIADKIGVEQVTSFKRILKENWGI
ncbi:MarR family winged helix-turn-helix transcriptional regulator [Oceanobacillus halotolerans]|uniref:MarR family winged helix-turn-helix transcriptional regulator n=1 Tax=Oceanobacillus halotolerans TaxID=2663380 RepID=UPI0013DD3B07|nr:MarR family transcriptional regulator [Oceanobacillus halotolerans]